jgi:predicted dinucleotide-binding enzyme
MKITVIGTGNMGAALARGIAGAHFTGSSSVRARYAALKAFLASVDPDSREPVESLVGAMSFEQLNAGPPFKVT